MSINLDKNGRLFDDTIFYCNREDETLIDEYILRNHFYKARKERKIPKGGVYCTPPELFLIEGVKNQAHLLNINFRNVQYIKDGNLLYWIYCLPLSNLYMFNFVGRNMTEGILKVIMDNSNFFLGFQREVGKRKIQVWYNPHTMYILVVHLENKKIVSKNIYYKKFDREDVVFTAYTTAPFKEDSYKNNIPLCERYTNWTKIVNVMTEEEINERKLCLTPFEIANVLTDHPELSSNYEEMLKYLFNK